MRPYFGLMLLAACLERAPQPLEPQAAPVARPTAPAPATSASARLVMALPPAAVACPAVCRGLAPPALEEAIRQRAGKTRRCYGEALRSDPHVHWAMRVTVPIGADGRVCESHVNRGELPDLRRRVLQVCPG